MQGKLGTEEESQAILGFFEDMKLKPQHLAGRGQWHEQRFSWENCDQNLGYMCVWGGVTKNSKLITPEEQDLRGKVETELN